MPCEIISSKGAVFAVWGEPSWGDIDRVIEEARVACEKWGSPVTYIARLPVNAPAPKAPVRRHLNEVLPAAMKYVSTYNVVVEGDGFTSALKRSVLVGLTQLTQRRDTFFIHSHVEAVLRTVSKSAQSHVREVLSLAAAQGLLQGDGSAGPPSSRYPAPPSSFPAPMSRFPGALAVIRQLSSRSVDGV